MMPSNNDEIWDEYQSKEYDLTPEDIEYVNAKLKNKLLIEVVSDKKFKLRTNGYVGVIKLPSKRLIRIIPRIGDSKFFEMIKYAFDLEIDYLNDDSSYKTGITFVDLIALLFINKIDIIINEGIYKSYINEQQNLPFIRGKILIQNDIKYNGFSREKIFCEYDELSYNVLENQIPLYALQLLLYSDLLNSIKYRVYEKIQFFQSLNIELLKIDEYQLDNLYLHKQNEYYRYVIKIARLIISSSYIESLSFGDSTAYSFLIDMDRVFEKFIEKLLIESYPRYDVIPQDRLQSIVRKEFGNIKDITIRPDVVIRNNGRNLLTVDTKYKNPVSIDRCDIYQALIYSQSNATNVILIYPLIDTDIYGTYQIENGQCIIVKCIKLESKNSGKQYIAELKEQLLKELEVMGLQAS